MDRDTNFFPWILGGLLIATAAAAAGLAFTRASAPTSAKPKQISHQDAVVAPPVVAQAQVPSPLSAPAIAARPELPSGQVWECVLNGQRTFSDSPCGDRPAIRQLSELNLIDSVASRTSPTYPPYPSGYAAATADQNAPDLSNDWYSTQEVLAIRERARRVHPSRPNAHLHGRSSQR
jgi:hypothetical protein